MMTEQQIIHKIFYHGQKFGRSNLHIHFRIMPHLFPPILARTVNTNHIDHIEINSKYIHQALTKKLNNELVSKYVNYQNALINV